jgi:hypothetical protein
VNDDQVVEVWNVLKEYIDKKQIELAAEKFVDTLADFGFNDESLKDMLGNDRYLDGAILYYLDIDNDEDYEEDE